MDIYGSREEHPFALLFATPMDSRARLMQLQADQEFFGEGEQTREALHFLLHPQSRLQAEITWCPALEGGETEKTGRFLENFNYGRLAIPSVLRQGKFKTVEAFLAAVHALCSAADTLLVEQVMEELNEDRRKAGFAQLGPEDREAVKRELYVLQEKTALSLAGGIPKEWKRPELSRIRRLIDREYRDRRGRYYGSYLLDRVAKELQILASE